MICFLFRKNVGLWCLWAVYFCLDIYLRLAAGIQPGAVFLTFRWTREMNYMRLAVAWGMFLVMLLLIVLTVLRFRKLTFPTDRSGKRKLLLLWTAFSCSFLAVMLESRLLAKSTQYIVSYAAAFTLTNVILDWFRLILLTAALCDTLRYFRTKNKNI